ncbi:cupin domain-containing protein [Priestia megaterium]|uniref:cupin domain-containing protein n=1 Tax=Priestia megaterium TaxID=1404 RepID=UPI003CFBD809
MSKSGFVPDNSNIKKSSGTPNLSVNYKQNVLFKRNDQNIAYQLTSTQLPAMLGGAFVDLYMTKGHMREPHWHPNAWELDVVVSGEVQVSILDPDTSSMHNYRIKEGEVVFIPMGWWHWIEPLSEETHLHLFFNNDQFESTEGSDVLRLTPPIVFQKAYGVSANEVAEAVAPITDTVVIGPPDNKKFYEMNQVSEYRRNGSEEQIIVKINEKILPSEEEQDV